MLDKRGLAIGAFVVCAILIAVVVRGNLQSPEKQLDAVFDDIASCIDARNPTVCSRPFIEKALTLVSGTDVLDGLERRFSEKQCHYLGHVVGQEMYRKHHDVETAIAECNYTCDSACIHGIIGEAFAQELGIMDPDMALDIDLQHLDPDEMRKVGKRLCSNSKTCHGVGHAMYQAHGAIAPALSMCKEIGGPLEQFCQHGVFMEYSDVLSQQNMRSIIEAENPDADSLASWCLYKDPVVRRSCFRYLPQIAILTFEKDGLTKDQAMSRFREMCMSYENDRDRIGCISGIGAHLSYSLVSDVSESLRRCAVFSERIDRAACDVGMISVATVQRRENALEYCAAAADDGLKRVCYQSMFFVVNLIDGSTADLARRCMDDICRGEEKNSKLDPLASIRANL